MSYEVGKKSTKYTMDRVLMEILGELIPVIVDGTVKIEGKFYKVAMVTDVIEIKGNVVEIVREARVVEKKYF